jgi:ankyrin repeat protein
MEKERNQPPKILLQRSDYTDTALSIPLRTYETFGIYLPASVPNDYFEHLHDTHIKKRKRSSAFQTGQVLQQTAEERRASILAYGDCDVYVRRGGGWVRHTVGELPSTIWVHCITGDEAPRVYETREIEASCAKTALTNSGGFCYQAATFQILYRTDLFGLLTPTLIRQFAPAFEHNQTDGATCYTLRNVVRAAYIKFTDLLRDSKPVSLTSPLGHAFALLLGICSMCPQIANNAVFEGGNLSGVYIARIPKLGDFVKVNDVQSRYNGLTGTVEQVTETEAIVQKHAFAHATLELVCFTDWQFFRQKCNFGFNNILSQITTFREIVEAANDFGCKVVAGVLVVEYEDGNSHAIMFSICEETSEIIFRNWGVSKTFAELVEMKDAELHRFFGNTFKMIEFDLVIDRRTQVLVAKALYSGAERLINPILSTEQGAKHVQKWGAISVQGHSPFSYFAGYAWNKFDSKRPWGEYSPLESAALHGMTTTIKLLIKLIKPQEFANTGFQNAINIAKTKGNTEIVTILKKALVPLITARDDEGRTILHYAVDTGLTIEPFQEDFPPLHDGWRTNKNFNARPNREQVLWLLQENADPNALDDWDATPLHMVTTGKGDEDNEELDLELMKLLMKQMTHKADLDQMDSFDVSPLVAAIKIPSIAKVQLLLENHADPNLVNHLGATPLARAAQFGHGAVAKQLIAANADVNKAKGKWTPLALAEHFGHSEIVAILKAASAK